MLLEKLESQSIKFDVKSMANRIAYSARNKKPVMGTSADKHHVVQIQMGLC